MLVIRQTKITDEEIGLNPRVFYLRQGSKLSMRQILDTLVFKFHCGYSNRTQYNYDAVALEIKGDYDGPGTIAQLEAL